MPLVSIPISRAAARLRSMILPPDKGPPVIDANHRLPSIFQVLHQYHGIHGQGLVCRGHGVHIISLAVGSGAAVKIGAVPGGNPFFPDIPRQRRWGSMFCS
jgi:hypothetical protein